LTLSISGTAKDTVVVAIECKQQQHPPMCSVENKESSYSKEA